MARQRAVCRSNSSPEITQNYAVIRALGAGKYGQVLSSKHPCAEGSGENSWGGGKHGEETLIRMICFCFEILQYLGPTGIHYMQVHKTFYYTTKISKDLA